MGLDNIPKIYPCKNHNTAILDEQDRIDCELTQKNGGCPWKNQKESNPLVANSRTTIGMFGTDCWYRGKYGNYLTGDMSSFNPDFPYDGMAFYGNGTEDGEGLSEDYCLELSSTMKHYTESWIDYVLNHSEVKGNKEDEQSLINDWIYAAWWLEFVGKNANGSEIWY